MVIDVVERFVLQHQGRWPHSWDELASTSLTEQSAVWNWPDDRDEIAKRVHVDFAVSTEQVRRMTPETFTAIVQIGPNYGPSEYRVESLIERVRKSIIESPGSPKEDGY